MAKFNRENKLRGKRDFGGRDSGGRGFGGRDRERPSMHDAVCDECGRKCQVPFRPTGDKPIYCSDCFEGRGGREDRGGRDERRSFGGGRERSSGNKERQMHSAVCSGCGNRCEVPFRPTGDKPVYCDNCFDKNKSTGSSKGDGQLKSQLDALNKKMDKILEILSISGIADLDDGMDSEIDWDIIEDETIGDDVKEEMIDKATKNTKKEKPVKEKKSKDKEVAPKKTEDKKAKKTTTKKKK